MNNSYINEIINKRFNTDKGYLYLIDMLKEKYPEFNINEDNLDNLSIEDVSKDMFMESGFVGIYTARDNTIRLFTNYDSDGSKILDGINISDEELINTFLHELIHCVSSKMDGDMIFEGFNMRMNGESSYFLGLNEGVTQMITDSVLECESDSYVLQTIFARQLGRIIGEDNLIKAYSNNDINLLEDLIMNINSDFNYKDFIVKMFYFNLINSGYLFNNSERIGTDIQEQLLLLGKDKISDLVITSEKLESLKDLLAVDINDISDIGFYDIDSITSNYTR